jgi:predicted dehydrogenase
LSSTLIKTEYRLRAFGARITIDEEKQMKTRFAFAGLRHAHVTALYQAVRDRPDRCEIAACAEENPQAREFAARNWNLHATHESIGQMLREVECDAVVVADTYGRRGAVTAAALRAGRHVLSDKPICMSIAELAEIERLARANDLRVGCQFDLRDRGTFRTMRRLIRDDGAIGPVRTITFLGQHPLMKQTRPSWYFEPGQHGGTINDIMIHAFDFLPWLTGQPIGNILSARAWGGEIAADVGDFQLCAQVMFALANGAGVLGDVSYLSPDGAGYTMPQYWRFTISGTLGLVETSWTATHVTLAQHADSTPRSIAPDADVPVSYLDDFLADISGAARPDAIRTETVFAASRVALHAQTMADRSQSPDR